MIGAPVLDAQVLDDLIEHIGADAARAVIRLFLDECRDLTGTIAAAGPEAVRRAAHSLKSSAAQLGASALAAAALTVEAAAESASPELSGLVAALVACAEQTEAALTARLAG